MKVVVTDYIESNLDWEARRLEERGIEFAAYQLKFRPEDEVVAACQDADVIVVNMVRFTESLIRRLPRCKLLIRHGIGYDNVDVAACTRHGLPFAYQPDYCKEDVAEHAIALLFACARKVVRSRSTLETLATLVDRGLLPADASKPWMRYAGMIESGDPDSGGRVDEVVYGRKD